jgi:prevent-host-death family protein
MATGTNPRMVNVHEAKTHFSKLLVRVEAGEEIVIARAGKPVAKIVRLSGRPRRRKGGFLKGLGITISDDFNDPLPPEVLDEFEGPIEP